ncbi:5-methyltetrahydropteroyltriglutamate--homocysteine S-methyltransferase [Secundilactobacillus similis DSM 23365 = JCM 2765]|uniref:Methionine synthase, vitamin-B12 independent n=1 Tax=Secundilactobacillus similis DSM 23365 = JCM 2765 TaxID=1423804 RepID=A0A0R2ET87_9LACO|nr:5-methyltetrahydropteroyltriglutamate--homocysteine S-methyltransferase [Secundilactobacillus similis]KRN15597.1 methionine synthase, vitamin-B12 independent [Secundilactobacillus similis DSM 23365 = JCM 2765]
MSEQTAVEYTKRTTSPFRYDVVGSFLRPESLKHARQQFANNEINAAELKLVEDQSIIELLHQEEKAGLKAVTDGEFRRSWWHLDFFWGLQGVEKVDLDSGYAFHAEETRAESARLTGELSGEDHPFVEHFKFTQKHASDNVLVKQTIPAPAQFLAELQRPENLKATQAVYATDDELIEGIAKAYHKVILDLYAAGCRNVQLDDCTWGMLVSRHDGARPGDPTPEEEQLDILKLQYVTVNNKAIADLPADLTVNTHICRGNYHSTWASAGGYESVAEPLFTKENVSAYFLEYDSERAGGFEPLKKVATDKLVVLGLITSKDGKLEDPQAIIDRIHEAGKYVPLDRLCLSTQCGFASTEEGNILTEAQQWEKIALVRKIANSVWGEE